MFLQFLHKKLPSLKSFHIHVFVWTQNKHVYTSQETNNESYSYNCEATNLV